MVTRLVIKQLYGHYDYDLAFSERHHIKVLLGPNGFGKSTILKILNNLIKCNFWYFNLIEFRYIRVEFAEGGKIHIMKNHIDESVKDLNTRNISESIFHLSLFNGEKDELQCQFLL